MQARQLRRAMAASSSSASASLGAVADVQRLLDEAVAERDSLASQLAEVRAAAAAAEGSRDRAAAEAQRASEERDQLRQQLEDLRAGLDEGSASAAAADARVAGLQVGEASRFCLDSWAKLLSGPGACLNIVDAIGALSLSWEVGCCTQSQFCSTAHRAASVHCSQRCQGPSRSRTGSQACWPQQKLLPQQQSRARTQRVLLGANMPSGQGVQKRFMKKLKQKLQR